MNKPIEIPITNETGIIRLLETAVMINATANTLLLMGAEILAHLKNSDVEGTTEHWLKVKDEFARTKFFDLKDASLETSE